MRHGQGLAGRTAALGAALGERFPLTRDLVLAGDLPVSSAHNVVEACAGLDIDAPTNLAGLCRRHHRMRQHVRGRPRLDPDGTITWTSTTGHTRTTEPQHRTT